MSSSITEAIGKRIDAAAREARRASIRLVRGDSPELGDQLDVEDSLENLQVLVRMQDDLREVAQDYEIYGRRSNNCLLRDLTTAQNGSEVAKNRLAAHRRALTGTETLGVEIRDLGTGSVFAAQIPDWITTSQAPTSIAAAPLLAYAQELPLHAGNAIDLVGFATPPVAAPQSAPNASVSNVDWADSTVSLPIRTFAGSFTIGLQALEQGKAGLDAQVLPRQVDAVNASLSASVIAGDGTSGNVVGLAHTPSASTQTWTSGSPTVADFVTNLETLIRKCEVGARGGHPVVILHPRRLSWLRASLTAASAPIPVTWSPSTIPAGTIDLNGVHILADGGVPTNGGTGTDEDIVIVVRDVGVLSDFYISAPVVFVDLSSGSATMRADVITRRYCAFHAGRLAGAVGVMSGTGLVAP